MATFWRDFGKATNDLVTRDFPTEFAWEAELKAPNDTKFKTVATRKNDGQTSASFEPTVTDKERGVTLKATFKTDRTVSGEVSLENKPVDGLKITVFAENKGDANTGKLTLDYKHKQRFTLSGVFAYPTKGKPTFTANSVVDATDSVQIGANAEFDVNAPGLQKWNARAAFKKPTYTFAAFAEGKVGDEVSTVIGLSHHHKPRDYIEVITELSTDTGKIGDLPKATFLTKYTRDANSSFKAKWVNDDSKLSLSVTQKVSDGVTVVFGTEHVLSGKKGAEPGSTKAGATLKLNF